MSFEVPEGVRPIRERVKQFIEERIYPVEHVLEERGEEESGATMRRLMNEAKAAGLWALGHPVEIGGQGMPFLDYVYVNEVVGRSEFAQVCLGTHSLQDSIMLNLHSSPEWREKYLRPLVAGEIFPSFAMTEPDVASSDPTQLQTRAVLDGDDWVINGQKIWATGAGANNNVISVYVKTDPKVHYRQGMSLFLVDKDAPGLKLRKLEMLGRRCVGTYELFFDDVRVPADRLIGGENKGWECVLSGLQVERIASTAGYCGGAQAVVDLALQYAKDRKQFGRPIGEFQSIAHMLADMQTEVDAARMLMWRAAWMLARGRDALREISMAKLFGSETYVKVANMGMQIFGAYGYNMEFDMQRHFRDARSTTIGAGTSQMQRNLIAGLMGLKVH